MAEQVQVKKVVVHVNTFKMKKMKPKLGQKNCGY